MMLLRQEAAHRRLLRAVVRYLLAGADFAPLLLSFPSFHAFDTQVFCLCTKCPWSMII